MRTRTTLELDRDLLREAATALGTTRVTNTIHAALAEAVAHRRRASLAAMELPDLTSGSIEVMRSPRTFRSVHVRASKGRESSPR